jgi:hypothetical protein
VIEGYNHDDIYIMVEDEFHSVAQAFTQHLHHAEYQRLKKKAREAPPPAFQPTDHMRLETRKKLEARALREKQKTAIGDITNGVNVLEEEEDEQDDEPWLGTSLAGFMTDAGSQKRTALVGLEKIQSTTRAARGFGRGTGDSPVNRKEKMSVFDIFGPAEKGEGDVVHEREIERLGDDLHPVSTTKITLPSSKSHEKQSSHKAGIVHELASISAPRLVNNAAEALLSTNKAADSRHAARTREPSVAARKLLDDFDKFDTVKSGSKVANTSRHPPSRKDNKSKQTKERKIQMNDIPTFLV